ncbi:hypothetical protein HPB50_022737 [Hyalomma asiaticum]|uniref:Uncharacterized protein n=1 Tax=Hyalomma asiaticum TaxID=266040 RepID=A0ACB7TRQ0_HYAAI|nr:hypothetical protein HPB50_022737 [Hyalomma asiaticum]
MLASRIILVLSASQVSSFTEIKACESLEAPSYVVAVRSSRPMRRAERELSLLATTDRRARWALLAPRSWGGVAWRESAFDVTARIRATAFSSRRGAPRKHVLALLASSHLLENLSGGLTAAGGVPIPLFVPCLATWWKEAIANSMKLGSYARHTTENRVDRGVQKTWTCSSLALPASSTSTPLPSRLVDTVVSRYANQHLSHHAHTPAGENIQRALQARRGR